MSVIGCACRLGYIRLGCLLGVPQLWYVQALWTREVFFVMALSLFPHAALVPGAEYELGKHGLMCSGHSYVYDARSDPHV